ncbi:dynein light chain Tctex-type 5-like isoform X2 [Dreissena polymorpha]|uniref:dynein light chain Tctex-type 5-like isoform X2 n=1 Tax=Dreissena polymorpha TaxID=45954 RepID=UPI002264B2A9|nr:dynein light chain Tctex-type 5-like isoform X2 [Dreissena polymorpha]XP_052237464.1 dynein light chain Tctex-type 5-like isoform X2 [Dreissena polymorpha]
MRLYSSLQVVCCKPVNISLTDDFTLLDNHTTKMKRNRGLVTGSPRIGRSKVLPISSARAAENQRANLRTETASFLEVTPITTAQPSADPRRHVKYENTYKLDPDQPFIAKDVQRVVERILADNLHDKYYEAAQCKTLSQLLSSRIVEELKRMGYSRFKIVSIVSIGSVKERPGVQLGSRCLWNKDTDNFVSAKYSNRSLFAVAMVYGLYYE